MPELWTVLLATWPVSWFMYFMNRWDMDVWLFWNLIITGLIGVVYCIELLYKSYFKG